MSRAARRLLALGLLTALAAAAALGPDAGRSAPAPRSKNHFTNSVGMKLIRVPAGKFTMGSPPDEVDREPGERQHPVEITKPFYLGVYEVTQGQFRKVTGTNASYHSPSGGGAVVVRGVKTDNLPVENLTWDEAVDFCRKLSALPREKAARRVYRLPSEAEWEYACRANAKKYAPFHYGQTLTTKEANILGGVGRPRAGGAYKPNAFGLYDMHGNVYEWCNDMYDVTYYRVSPKKDPSGPAAGTDHVCRGGAWNRPALPWARCARRSWGNLGERQPHIGMRAACDVHRGR
jgi:formylglycine-generating enzyme required for sulfatase activity